MERADLVLGGGGVRGTALVGAMDALVARGIEVGRVAGVSAGALVGALAVAGATPDAIRSEVRELDFSAFALADVFERLAGSALGGLLDRLRPDRVQPLTWIADLLQAHGVRTWADLADPDPLESTPPRRRYRLVVRCLDITNRRVVRLPWDYEQYGLEADEQSVAQAVRASMSVPLVFEPVQLGNPDVATATLVDGGLGSGFSVSVLDRPDGAPPRWPTFGVRLLPRFEVHEPPDGEVAVLRALLTTLLVAGDDSAPVAPRDVARTCEIDTSAARSLDVRRDARREQQLDDAGRDAMGRFLDDYDHEAWVSRFCHTG